MRIAILNMPVRTSAPCNNVPLGIYRVSSAINEALPEVEIKYIDLNLYRPELTRDQLHTILAANRADMFMLSGLITTLRWHTEVSNAIRGMYPKAKIVAGGGLATNIGEELCDWIPIDAVCTGEGEAIAPRIVRDAQADELFPWYDGIAADMDSLPPFPWDEVEGLETYIQNPVWGSAAKNSSAMPYTMKRSLNIVSSRGCPFSCKFCSRDTLGGRNYRAMPPTPLGREVLRLVGRYNLDWIGFVDDNFLARRTSEISEVLSWLSCFHDLKASWGCHARFDECDDGWLLDRLHDGCCRYIGFGGESANAEILASMNKKNDPDQMKRVIRLCRDAGIHPSCTWMAGWPGETRLQVRDTAQFILKHAPENKCMFVPTAYPGTELWTMVKDKILAKFGTLRAYVETLADATKPVINLSAMSDSDFLEVRCHIDAGELEKI